MARLFFYPFKKHTDEVSTEKNRTALEEFLNSLVLPDGPIGGGDHYSGSGPPGASLGADADVYFDIANGDIWLKDPVNGWTLVFDGLTTDQIVALVEARIEWKNKWTQQQYVKNDMVLDGSFTMIANKPTTDRAAPQPDGPALWILPDDPVWSVTTVTDYVRSGMRIVVPEGRLFLVEQIRIWVEDFSPDTTYQLYLVDNITGIITSSQVFKGDIAPFPQWVEMAVDYSFVGGEDITVTVLVENHSATTDFTYRWNRQADSQGGAPISGGWLTNNQQTVLRVHKSDAAAIDRSVDLDTVTPGTDITFTNIVDPSQSWQFSVLAATDSGDFMTFDVVLETTGSNGPPPPGSQSDALFEVPIPGTTDYVVLPAYLTPFPSISGVLAIGDAEIENQDANAVDLHYQEFRISDDWDIVSIFGTGSGSGGGSEPTPALQQLEAWPTGPTQLDGPYVVTGNVLTVPAGRGVIMNSYDDPENTPIVTGLDWDEQTIDFGFVLGRHLSYVYVDAGGIVQFDVVTPDAALLRRRMYLGRIFHDITDGSLGKAFRPWHMVPNQAAHTLQDLIGAIGGAFLFRGGNVDPITGTMGFATDDQKWFSIGESWFQDRDDPNIANNPGSGTGIPQVFEYMDSLGNRLGATTVVDPDNYESSPGIITDITGSPNRSTIQRLYTFIDGSYLMSYGQEIYDNLEDALNQLPHDIQNHQPPAYVENEAQIALVAYFIMEHSANDLDDGEDVVIINDDRLPIGGGGSSVHSHDATYLKLSGGTMAGDINMDQNFLYNLPDAENPGDAVSKSYVEAWFLPLTGGVLSGRLTAQVGISIWGGSGDGLIISSALLPTGTSDNHLVWNGTTGVVERRTVAYLQLTGGTMSGDIHMGSNRIRGLPSLSDGGDASGFYDGEINVANSASNPGGLSTTLTFSNAAVRIVQFNINKTGQRAFIRGIVGNGPEWQPWVELANLSYLDSYLLLAGGALTGRVTTNNSGGNVTHEEALRSVMIKPVSVGGTTPAPVGGNGTLLIKYDDS